MASLVNRCWATRFSLLRRISVFKSTRMISTAVNSTPSSSSRVMSPPWLMLPPVIEEGGDMVYKFYNLSEDKEESFRRNSEEEMADDDAKFVGSSHGWLATLNQRNNNHLFLYNPITRRHIKLPPIETLPHLSRGIVSKLILSSSPDDYECIAMMIYGPGDRLAFCNPCRSTKWTPIPDFFPESYPRSYDNLLLDTGVLCYRKAYDDIVYCGMKRFSSTTPFRWEDWDLKDPHSPVLETGRTWRAYMFSGDDEWMNQNAELLDNCRQINHLIFVEEHNQLFIVVRFVMGRVAPDGSYVHVGEIPYDPISRRLLVDTYPYKTIFFFVRQLRGERMLENMRLIEGGSLVGLTMFIGMNHSFAVSSADYPNLKPNSIYFTDANKHDNSIYGGHDIGIFDYANKTLSNCYCYPCDIPSLKRIAPPPMWFTPSSY